MQRIKRGALVGWSDRDESLGSRSILPDVSLKGSRTMRAENCRGSLP